MRRTTTETAVSNVDDDESFDYFNLNLSKVSRVKLSSVLIRSAVEGELGEVNERWICESRLYVLIGQGLLDSLDN